MKISEKIYRLRTENDMTQVEFGKLAGASDKAVSTWKRGDKEPRMKALQHISAHFNKGHSVQYAKKKYQFPKKYNVAGLYKPLQELAYSNFQAINK